MELTRLLGYCGGSFEVGFVSGLVPAVNTEAYLLALVALAPRAAVAPAVLFVTAGQMLAKALLYLAGSGALQSRFLAAPEGRLAAVRRRLGRMQRGASAVLFSSALTGIPPFYVVSVAASSCASRSGTSCSSQQRAPAALRGDRRAARAPGSGTMSLRLLVDAPEFTAALAVDLAAARRSALVQAMTFEGDSAGESVASSDRGLPRPRPPRAGGRLHAARAERPASAGGRATSSRRRSGASGRPRGG
jgi:membrane protein YqaA with SNARE-associated domain